MPRKLTGKGDYYHVRRLDPKFFKKFRTHDVGRPSHTKRRAGVLKRTGKWDTQGYLFSKQDFRVMKVKGRYRLRPKRTASLGLKEWFHLRFLRDHIDPMRRKGYPDEWQTRQRRKKKTKKRKR